MGINIYNRYCCELDPRHLFTPADLEEMRQADAEIDAEYAAYERILDDQDAIAGLETESPTPCMEPIAEPVPASQPIQVPRSRKNHLCARLAKSPEQRNADCRAYYRKHREEIIAYKIAWHRAHPYTEAEKKRINAKRRENYRKKKFERFGSNKEEV